MNLVYHKKCLMSRQNILKRIDMARIIDGDNKNLIGGNLKKLRIKLKVSQQELSNKLELLGVYVCRGSISRIEDYSRTVTDIELFAIAEVLGVDPKELYHKT